MTNITQRIAIIKAKLASVPKYQRNAHHQMASRYIKDAQFLLPRNSVVAHEKALTAAFHVQFV